MCECEKSLNDTLNYINRLKNGSFAGWNEESKKGYLTACISISEFINDEITHQKNAKSYSRFK